MNVLLANLDYPVRILAIIGFIIGVHLIVILVRALGSKLMLILPRGTFVKARSLAGLLTSAAIFVLYYEVEKKTMTPVPKKAKVG